MVNPPDHQSLRRDQQQLNKAGHALTLNNPRTQDVRATPAGTFRRGKLRERRLCQFGQELPFGVLGDDR